MSAQDHRAQARTQQAVACAVITISDTRDESTDRGGPRIREILSEFGHRVLHSEIVRDEPAEIRAAILRSCANPAIDAILTTGGTGIAPRDQTIDVVSALLTVEIPGFGELFRMLSWEQVGSAAMLSRAIAGVVATPEAPARDVIVFALPGSVKALELAMNRLIGPELAHLVWEIRKPSELSG